MAVAACQRSGADASPQTAPSGSTEVQPNDNRRTGGSIRDGVLRLALEIREGDWRAERTGPVLRILAFAEAGRPLENPAPLIRVREGTVVEVSIRSLVNGDIVVHGLHDRSGPAAPLRVPGNGAATARFTTGPAGTYYYWGTRGDALEVLEGADSQGDGSTTAR